MNKGPSLFSDFGKKARDLLIGDFNADQKLSVSTYTSAGVALTSSAVKKGGLSTGDLGAIYEFKNTIVDVKVNTASTIATTLTLTDILPSTKALASLKLPECSGKLEVQYQPDKFQYLHDIVAFTTAVAHKQSTVVDFSASVGNSAFACAIQASYDTSNGKIKFSTGTEVTTPDYSCSAVFVGVTLDSMKVSVATNVGKLTTLGAEFHRVLSLGYPTDLSTVTIGCSRILDPLTKVKVKLNNVGQLAAVLQHEFIPKSMLTVSTELDVKALDRTPKFGLALTLEL